MTSAKRLGDVLGAMLRESPFKEHAEAARILEAWPTVVGEQIDGMTEVLQFRSGKLFVEVGDAPWRHVLHLQREQWRRQLNDHVGEILVEEIVFR